MIHKLNAFILSFVTTLALPIPQFSYGSDETRIEVNTYSNSPFESLPFEIRERIIIKAATYQILDNKPLAKLAYVDSEWNEIVQDSTYAKLGITDAQDEKAYRTFLNGKLIYRPDDDGGKLVDEGKVEVKISALKESPLQGSFDLSRFRTTSNSITITADPSIFFGGPGCKSYVVLLAPYFWVKKNMTSSIVRESQNPFKQVMYQRIMENWDKSTAPIGIAWRSSDQRHSEDPERFWRMGGFSRLVSASMESISERNLYENWKKSSPTTPPDVNGIPAALTILDAIRVSNFTFCFKIPTQEATENISAGI